MQYVGKTMRYANRIDENQNEIVKALRKAGAYVRIISQGDGIPDLLVAYKGYTILMEVKDGDKVPSARKLTEAEQKFFDEWTGGLLVIVNSVDEALETLKRCE
jgi:Holliday junction resolvase